MVLHYAGLAACGGRRRRLPDRLGAARPDARALGLRRLSRGRRAGAARERGEIHSRPRHARHLWRRLDRVRRACGRSRRQRDALSARRAMGVACDRCGRDRLLRAAVGLARHRRSSRPAAREHDLRPRLSRPEHPRRGGVRLVLRKQWRTRGAGAHADHRRARQALGVSRQGSVELVVQPALRARRRRGAADADRLGPAEQADLDHRGRLSGGRQGREPAERVSRPEIRRGRRPVFFRRAARRPDPAPPARSDARDVRPGLRGDGREQSALGRVRPAHGRSVRHPSVDVGCASVPGLPGGARRMERRAELGHRPLAHRAARIVSARCARRADFGGRRRRRMRREHAARLDGRLCDRSADVAARRARTARRGVRLRGCDRRRAPELSPARRAAGRRTRRG